MSPLTPRWNVVKARIPGLKTAFGIVGVGAFWTDVLGKSQEHYEQTPQALLEWFELRLRIDQEPAKADPPPKFTTAWARAKSEPIPQEYLEAAAAANKAFFENMTKPKEQPKPKPPVNPYRRRFS